MSIYYDEEVGKIECSPIEEKENLFDTGRLLYKFLVSKGAYRQYLFNSLKNDCCRDLNQINKMKILAWLQRKSIVCAFTWADTLEGQNYWSRLNNEWKAFYDYHTKEMGMTETYSLGV